MTPHSFWLVALTGVPRTPITLAEAPSGRALAVQRLARSYDRRVGWRVDCQRHCRALSCGRAMEVRLGPLALG
jgi:hypothetical protein